MRDAPSCTIVGCDTVAKSLGLCNTHYMAQWRAQERQILDEAARAKDTFDDPSDYFCEGYEDCTETPDRWWVKDGKEPRAICPACVERLLFDFRLNIRRLELS